MTESKFKLITTEVTCPFCGKKDIVLAEAERLRRWENGELIQNVFPEWSTDKRELLMTGICKKCW